MVTIYDIATKANVSPMTVSRVINKSGKVSEATRTKVENAINELNYIPNSSARSLTSKKSKILSLVITDITNPFFTKVARGAEDKAKQMGYSLLLCNSDEDIDKESDYINMLVSTGVGGVLITPSEDKSRKNLRTLNKYNIPFILLDRKIEGINCDAVHGDSQEGTRKILEHLINKGHRKIAIINGPLDISTARERQKAYIETLNAYNLPVHEELILQSHYKNKDSNSDISKLLSVKLEKRPTAIFAANNFIAINTIKELRKINIRVPEDISVVCFDDLDPSIDLNPFLTVVAQPAYHFGFTGAQMLIERIEKTAPPEFRKIVLPSKLIVRNSSAHN
ncbi:LacI family DNA-binding transcriptional regulator [Pseudalkalibacillus decolorationis]|uniref:LacI family DNA-binding transcriptional regulator n=1 Tax=Pseudalkalibacillus decolorationis TaxID=163879 RepID=UPI00214984CB|nr:LacI family DNA-binding transcriptional regulator [Pseudalkalibacillus decolorationis]